MNDYFSVFLSFLIHYQTDTSTVYNEWQRIQSAYDERHRFYHNQTHIQKLLELWSEHQTKLHDAEAVFYAIVYHDFIYDANSQQNEANSAAEAIVFLSKIGLPSSKIEKVKTYILATQGHQSLQEDTDLMYFLDFDLAILGSQSFDYEQYSKNIRKEYNIYDDVRYKAGRMAVLKHFLSKSQIYKTDFFRQQFEKQAFENMKRELKALEN
jgi:predicted metal-dependent HD superfamily phosphohydrolase